MDKLFEKAENEGIEIVYDRFPKAESMCIESECGDFVLMDNHLAKSEPDEKVHLAHELGHIMTGAFYNLYSPFDIRKKHENRADKWAIQELVPKDELDRAAEKGYHEVYELAEYFNVTEEFMQKAICWYTHGNLAVECYY